MFSPFSRTALTLAGLTPVPIIIAANCLVRVDQQNQWAPDWQWALGWLALAIVMVVFTLACTKHFIPKLGNREIKIEKVKHADKEVVAFVATYTVAFSQTQFNGLKNEHLTAVIILVIIFLTVVRANSFVFNPVLAWNGFHFYEVECDDNVTYFLITRNKALAAKTELVVKPLSPSMFYDVTAEK
jgi:uncharacterized membrane protein